jgi:acyl-CoA hydrolase
MFRIFAVGRSSMSVSGRVWGEGTSTLVLEVVYEDIID